MKHIKDRCPIYMTTLHGRLITVITVVVIVTRNWMGDNINEQTVEQYTQFTENS